MKVKELELKLAELKAQGKISDDSHILLFNDEFCELYETSDIITVDNDSLYNLNQLKEDIERCKKDGRPAYFLKDKEELLDNLNGKWKDAIRII